MVEFIEILHSDWAATVVSVCTVYVCYVLFSLCEQTACTACQTRWIELDM